MPSLADVYEPEHLAAATDLCEWIHDEPTATSTEQRRRGFRIPCSRCVNETAPALPPLASAYASDPWGA